MPSNVEVKARVSDIENIKTRASSLSKSEGHVICQEDTFFNVPNGRLKLRQIQGAHAELIFYDRPDQEGPKLSKYSKQDFPDVTQTEGLKACLACALGVKGVVRKTRILYMIENTRVHVDSVEGLGDFMELEVMLQENQTPEEGQKVAEKLMNQLGVVKENLLCGSYLDLQQQCHFDNK